MLTATAASLQCCPLRLHQKEAVVHVVIRLIRGVCSWMLRLGRVRPEDTACNRRSAVLLLIPVNVV